MRKEGTWDPKHFPLQWSSFLHSVVCFEVVCMHHRKDKLGHILPKSSNSNAEQAESSRQEQEGISELTLENHEVKNEWSFENFISQVVVRRSKWGTKKNRRNCYKDWNQTRKISCSRNCHRSYWWDLLIIAINTRCRKNQKILTLIHLLGGFLSLFTVAEERVEEETTVFQVPIWEREEEVRIKDINQTILPHFHGMVTEDPDTFLIEFEVLYKTYDYNTNAKKLIDYFLLHWRRQHFIDLWVLMGIVFVHGR